MNPRIGLFVALFVVTGVSAQNVSSITLEAGSAHVLRLQTIKQVAVGNSQLVQANAVSANEVIVFAKQVGTTTVDIWTKKGEHHAYQINITASGLKQKLGQIQSVLKEFSGLSARLAGQHIVIEGQDVSSGVRKRLDQLLARHPDVVDLTSEITWDPMVMLDVKVLEIPRHHMRELGVSWQASANGGFHIGAATRLGAAGLEIAEQGPLSGHGALLGMSELFTAKLHALNQSGQAVLLAQPQLLARSGSPASFQAGGEVPYAFVDKEGKRTTLFKKYGVMLNVTPEVDRNGAIRGKAEIEISSIDPSISTEAGPAIRTRKTSTEFNVRSGQSLVLGGFLSHEAEQGQRGIAGIHTQQKRQVELAIFLTPTIVTPDHPDLMARVARGQTIEDWQIGQEPQINVPISSEAAAHAHHWNPAHPSLSQWQRGSPVNSGNTYSFD